MLSSAQYVSQKRKLLKRVRGHGTSWHRVNTEFRRISFLLVLRRRLPPPPPPPASLLISFCSISFLLSYLSVFLFSLPPPPPSPTPLLHQLFFVFSVYICFQIPIHLQISLAFPCFEHFSLCKEDRIIARMIILSEMKIVMGRERERGGGGGRGRGEGGGGFPRSM